jgi:hypothetical protein
MWQLNSTFSFGSQAVLVAVAVCAKTQSGLKQSRVAISRFMAIVLALD